MPEEPNNAPNPDANTDPNNDPNGGGDGGGGGGGQENLLAGKYASQADLEKGIRELAPHAGYQIAENESVIGESGLFKSVDEGVAAYKAMERMRSKRQAGEQDTPPAQDGGEDKPAAPDKPASDDSQLQIPDAPQGDETLDGLLQKAGLKAEDVQSQWQEKGELTADQYTALAAQGLPRAIVDGYFQGQAAQAQITQQQQQQIRRDAAEIAGGEEQLNNLLSTARQYVPADEIESLNQMLSDAKHYKAALRIIMDHKKQALGAGNSEDRVNGEGGSGASPITSRKDYFDTVRKAARGDSQAEQRLREHVSSRNRRITV